MRRHIILSVCAAMLAAGAGASRLPAATDLFLPGASPVEQMRIANALPQPKTGPASPRPATPAPVEPPAPEPTPAPQPAPAPAPAPPPPADPADTVDPVLGGYYRADLTSVAGAPVLCLTDAAWPSSSSTATGLWDGSKIVMRTWRCDGLVPSKLGSELFARGLFVLSHESVHAGGQPDECEADKGGVARMPAFSAALGFGEAAGISARDLILNIYRAAPLPPPYCLGHFA